MYVVRAAGAEMFRRIIRAFALEVGKAAGNQRRIRIQAADLVLVEVRDLDNRVRVTW